MFLHWSLLFFTVIFVIHNLILAQSNDVDNSTIEIPLIDKTQMPLVAMLDTTKLNTAIRTYIKETVKLNINDIIPEVKRAVIDDIGYEPRRQIERPAFSASLTSTRKSLGSKEIVKFDKIWLNIGHHYDSSNGVFTVSETGLYFFSSTVMSDNKDALQCHLWKNDQSNVALNGTKSAFSTGTINIVLTLAKGDRIYIKYDNSVGEGIYGEHFSMFSGFLIS